MINIIGPINQLGYGISALNIVKSLSKLTDVSLWCIGNPQVTNENDADIIRKCINNGRFTDFKAPCIKIWHQNDMTQFVGTGPRIGFPIFELDEFNDLEKHHLNSLDKIFVCSQWAKDVVLSQTILKNEDVHVVPLGVDNTIFKKSDNVTNSATRFFNCGKWEIRKGHDVLVEIFNEAFDIDDNVELFLMCQNPFCSEAEEREWQNLYLNSKLGNKIHIIPRRNTQEEVYNIMSQTHCGVFPSRAEGWNLELLEMMACGKYVITTDYSAHKEFCNAANAYLIPISQKEVAYDGKWFHGHGKWAKIDTPEKEICVQHMKSVHKLVQSNNLQINEAGIDTAQKYNWENSAKEILNVL